RAVVNERAAQQNAVAELMRVSPVADELATRFHDAGHQFFLVGGSVRDAMLGELSGDPGFTTAARPQRILELVSSWADAVWETGIAFGTVGCSKRGIVLEITTFRADSYDRVGRNPEVTYGDTIEGDLWRRDSRVKAAANELTTIASGDPHARMPPIA